MIDVRIVCTHDAVKVAEGLMRLLGAEEHQVQLSYGRKSIDEIDDAETRNEAVLLVWSLDAPSTHYMLEWAARIDPVRLVEIGRTAGAPRIEGRRAGVIDFTSWRGERGGRQWNALIERLRIVQNAVAPQGPAPHRAAIALGIVSAAAVGGAVLMRVHDALEVTPQPTLERVAATEVGTDGIGGPLQAVEPASIEDLTVHFHAPHRMAPMDLPADLELTDLDPVPAIEIRRERTLLARLNDLTGDIAATLSGGRRQSENGQTASSD